MDYEDFNDVNQCLKEAQDAEEDMRALAKDALVFITKQDGQWEPDRWSDNQGKPRYTFDQTTPIVDQIAGDLDDSDFDIKVSPADGSATKEGAELIDGIIRNIERLSEARHIYSDAARNMVTSGIDHWMVETDYVNSNSFDQEIKISPILIAANASGLTLIHTRSTDLMQNMVFYYLPLPPKIIMKSFRKDLASLSAQTITMTVSIIINRIKLLLAIFIIVKKLNLKLLKQSLVVFLNTTTLSN